MTTTVRHIDEHLFSDETCDHQCIALGRDGNHRCIDAIVRHHPDGCSVDMMAFYLGVSPPTVEAMIDRSLKKLPTRLRRALGDACDDAA